MRYQRIKELCKANGVTITGLEKELGFARGSLSKIDQHFPSADKIQKISDRLHTTPDYILYGAEKESNSTDNIFSAHNQQEQDVLISFRGAGKMTDEEFAEWKNMFDQTLDIYLKARGKK